MVERLLLGPGAAQQADIFGGAAIACGMVGPVAVLGLIGVAAAGDDVHRETAAAQLVERRQLARGERRRDKAGAVRQQKAEPLGHRGGMRPDQEPVRRIREIADQHAVEAGPLVNARRLGDDFGVEWRARGRDQLRRHPRRDPADNLDRHVHLPDAAPAHSDRNRDRTPGVGGAASASGQLRCRDASDRGSCSGHRALPPRSNRHSE